MRDRMGHTPRVRRRAAAGWGVAVVLAAGLALAPVLPCAAAPPEDPAASSGDPAGTGAPATGSPGSAGATPTTPTSPSTPTTPTTPSTPSAPVPPPAGLADAAAGADGSITAVVLSAGGDLLTAAGPDRVLPTASLVKVLVVEELLRREAAGRTTLAPADLDRMRAALVTSDDSAMNALWTRHGGADLVAAAAARYELEGTGPPPVAGQWGLAPTTARDTAVVLSDLARDEGPVGSTVMGWLRQVSPVADDGFDQVYGVLGPVGAVAAKQGWMCCVDGQRHLHSAGVLADGRVVVVLGEFPTGTAWAEAAAALDGAAASLVAATAPGEVPVR